MRDSPRHWTLYSFIQLCERCHDACEPRGWWPPSHTLWAQETRARPRCLQIASRFIANSRLARRLVMRCRWRWINLCRVTGRRRVSKILSLPSSASTAKRISTISSPVTYPPSNWYVYYFPRHSSSAALRTVVLGRMFAVDAGREAALCVYSRSSPPCRAYSMCETATGHFSVKHRAISAVGLTRETSGKCFGRMRVPVTHQPSSCRFIYVNPLCFPFRTLSPLRRSTYSFLRCPKTMLTEAVDEGLVLLGRILGWDMIDLTYASMLRTREGVRRWDDKPLTRVPKVEELDEEVSTAGTNLVDG